MRVVSKLSWALGFTLVAGFGSSCNLDPVHRAGVNNLGPEQADKYPPDTEYHRPGEPCALCHSKQGPADSDPFLLAGTVFWGPDNYDRRVNGAYVRILDANKTRKCVVTNCNGNFFLRPDPASHFPTFPLLISVERVKDPTSISSETMIIKRMTGHIGREASCATCHIQGLRDFGSPGQIRLYDTEDQATAANPPITACPAPLLIDACPEDRL